MQDKIYESVLFILLSLTAAGFLQPMYAAGRLAESAGQNYAPFLVLTVICLMTTLLSIMRVCHIWDGRV